MSLSSQGHDQSWARDASCAGNVLHFHLRLKVRGEQHTFHVYRWCCRVDGQKNGATDTAAPRGARANGNWNPPLGSCRTTQPSTDERINRWP